MRPMTNACRQCGKPTPPGGFIGKRGGVVTWCPECREHYANWHKKTPEERRAVPTRGVEALEGSEYRARLFLDSKNPKLGGIPTSITGRASCPSSCAFYSYGCYALYMPQALHWRRVTTDTSNTWERFCADVARLPQDQLWRHNVAGDLPGRDYEIHRGKLNELVEANRRANAWGFTFTHAPVLPLSGWRFSPERLAINVNAIRDANARGFTVNLSAESLEQADRMADLGIGPVSVVLPEDAPEVGLRTPARRRVVVCPAERFDNITCDSCRLCAMPKRKAIVGFRAHGQARARVSELVTLRRKSA